MADKFKRLVPVRIYTNKKGEFRPLPLNEINPIDSILSHRVTPAQRSNETGELQTGNFIQRPRLKADSKMIASDDLVSGVKTKKSCRLERLQEQDQALTIIEPVLQTGYYNIGKHDFFLYGDHMVMESIEGGATTGTLAETPDPLAPVRVAIWTRDFCDAAVPHREARMVNEFLGDLIADGRHEVTLSDDIDEIIFDNTTESPDWTLNQPMEEAVLPSDPYGSSTKLEFIMLGDVLGESDGKDCQRYYTKFFPLDTSRDIHVFTMPDEDDDRIDLIEWTAVDTHADSLSPLDQNYTVDTTLGIIEFGGTRGVGGKLREDFLSGETRAVLCVDTYGLPDSGVIEFSDGANTELVQYYSKTDSDLLRITRPGPTFDWPKGTSFRVPQTGAIPKEGQKIVAGYYAVPGVLYSEYTGKEEARTLARRPENLLAPYELQNNEAIVCVDRCNYKIGSIILTPIDINGIFIDGEFCYGPVYAEEMVVVVEALVLSDKEKPIPNAPVTIEVQGPGTVNYSKRINLRTNSEGKAFFTYIPGNDVLQPLYATSGDVTYVGGKTRIDFNWDPSDTLVVSDLGLLHLYTVTKDDPTIGSVGRHWEVPIDDFSAHPDVGSYIGRAFSDSAPSPSYLTDNNITDGFLMIGTPYMRNTDAWGPQLKDGELKYSKAVIEYSAIVGTNPTAGTLVVDVERVYPDSSLWSTDPLPGGLVDSQIQRHTYVVALREELAIPGSIQRVWLQSPEDNIWSSADLNGRLGVVRTLVGDPVLDPHGTPGNWLHPASDEIAAVYKPVTPSAWIGGNVLEFESELPLPDEDDNLNNLGAYAIFGQLRAEINAWAQDPSCTNVFVYSDPLCFYVTLSPRDSGTVKAGTDYVPYGFRLRSETFDGASRIGTGTYLTINSAKRVANTAPYRVPLISQINDGSIIYDTSSDVYDALPNSVSYLISVGA
jgi:hypothetical protein